MSSDPLSADTKFSAETPLTATNLTLRTYNLLDRLLCRTVGDVAGVSEDDLRCSGAGGQVVVDEVADLLEAAGLGGPERPQAPDLAAERAKVCAAVEELADSCPPYMYSLDSCVVVVASLAGLRALALQTVRSDDDVVAYESVHGGVVRATEEVFCLLDTLLEKLLPHSFAWVREREDWEDDDDDTSRMLPAGPGPYGSGVRALGSVGERVDFATDRPPYLPADQGTPGDAGDQAPHAREPWRELTGEAETLREWLYQRMRWTMSDDHYAGDPRNEKERAIMAATMARRQEFADRFVETFPPHRSRYFVGGHAGWDRWSEDYPARDEVIGFVSAEDVAVLWMGFDRFYG